MKALCWHGKGDVRIDSVPDPKIQDARDAIVRITTTAICGSDLHLYNGLVPTMQQGDILGHEPMGEVVEVGRDVHTLKVGDRVVVPFTISCGECFFCQKTLFSLCDTSNPNAEIARKQMGHAPAGLFGFSHMLGGFPGGQAEYLRVPFADVGPLKIPAGVPDEQVVFLSDIFPTGYMAAENASIEAGDTVAVWGCGPVGQFAIRSAWMLGAGRVIAIDRVAERLAMAERGKAELINFDKEDVYDRLMEMTKGRGPDSCIDAVGAEAHATGSFDAVIDAAKVALHTKVELALDLPKAETKLAHGVGIAFGVLEFLVSLPLATGFAPLQIRARALRAHEPRIEQVGRAGPAPLQLEAALLQPRLPGCEGAFHRSQCSHGGVLSMRRSIHWHSKVFYREFPDADVE